jgi:cytochrome b-561
VVLTIVGTFLRGPYWEFYWPWQAWPETPTHF